MLDDNVKQIKLSNQIGFVDKLYYYFSLRTKSLYGDSAETISSIDTQVLGQLTLVVGGGRGLGVGDQ